MQNLLMKISLRTYTVVFLILTSAFIFFSYQKTASTTYVPQTQVKIVDQALKGVKATRFDENGNIIQVLNMTSWQHLQGDLQSALVNPHLIIYQPNGEHWDIRAKEGQSKQTQVHGKIEALTLSNDVIVTRLNPKQDSMWALKTKQMVVHPQLSLATTQENVLIEGQGTQIEAKGMRANLKEHTIQLLDDVKSHYVAPKV